MYGAFAEMYYLHTFTAARQCGNIIWYSGSSSTFLQATRQALLPRERLKVWWRVSDGQWRKRAGPGEVWRGWVWCNADLDRLAFPRIKSFLLNLLYSSKGRREEHRPLCCWSREGMKLQEFTSAACCLWGWGQRGGDKHFKWPQWSSEGSVWGHGICGAILRFRWGWTDFLQLRFVAQGEGTEQPGDQTGSLGRNLQYGQQGACGRNAIGGGGRGCVLQGLWGPLRPLEDFLLSTCEVAVLGFESRVKHHLKYIAGKII